MYSSSQHRLVAPDESIPVWRQVAVAARAERSRHRHRSSLRLRVAALLIKLGERLAAGHATASVRPA